MGNISSIIGGLEYHGVSEIVVSNKPEEFKAADKLILPGVGSFRSAMNNITSLGIDQYLIDEILGNKKPVLGICLGMQLMGKSSSEDGNNLGLGFIDAKVEQFPNSNLKVPHVGHNQIQVAKNSKLFEGIKNLSDFYFVHSYYMTSDESINQSICNYGVDFICSYEVNNIFGVQFHPELSQYNGLKIINNFLKS